MPGRLAGVGLLTALALRRDRWLVALWVVLLGATCAASALATDGLYASRAERVSAAAAVNGSPATLALYGPVLDPTSRGELAMTKLTVLYAVLVAVLALVVVRRHTRTEEESGRAELVAGTGTGRQAPLAAAVLVAASASLLVGLVAALADAASGLPLGGSLLFGASWAGTGLVGVGLGVVVCQLSASRRTCLGAGFTVLAVLYALRAAADVNPDRLGALGWLSPLGWSTRLSAWSDPRPWVLVLPVVTTVALLGVAVALQARRDLGSGLVAARPGPARGSAGLRSGLSLVWRTDRGSLAAWTVALAALGLLVGAVAPGVGALLDSPAAREALARVGGSGSLQDVLVGTVLSLVGVLATAHAVGVVAAAGADEQAGRTEVVLATATSRGRLLGAQVLVAVVGSTWLLLVSGVATALGLAIAGSGGSGSTGGARVVLAAVDQAPAVWVVTGVAVLLLALRASWAVAGWFVLVLCVGVGQLGELLGLPGIVTGLSPYGHLPAMPAEGFAATPVVALSGVAAALLGAAWWRLERRGIG